MSDKDAREEAAEKLLQTLYRIENERTAVSSICTKEKIAAICEFLAAESQRTQAPSGQSTRFDEFDDDSHPFHKWWIEHGQYMLSGGGRRESIWAARGWIAREQLICDVEVTGDSMHEFSAGTQAQAAQWISTKERLPELGKFVPVVIGGYVQHTMARMDGDEWDWPYDADCAPLSVVTHWLDFLPVAPVAALEGKKTNG